MKRCGALAVEILRKIFTDRIELKKLLSLAQIVCAKPHPTPFVYYSPQQTIQICVNGYWKESKIVDLT